MKNFQWTFFDLYSITNLIVTIVSLVPLVAFIVGSIVILRFLHQAKLEYSYAIYKKHKINK